MKAYRVVYYMEKEDGLMELGSVDVSATNEIEARLKASKMPAPWNSSMPTEERGKYHFLRVENLGDLY